MDTTTTQGEQAKDLDELLAYLDDELHPVVTHQDRYDLYNYLHDCVTDWQAERDDHQTEVDRLKEARKRIKELEAALADAHIDNCLEHAFLEIACERMETDLDDFKKKNALTLSDVRRRRGLK